MNTDCPYCARTGYLDTFTKGESETVKVRLPYHVRQSRFFNPTYRDFNKPVKADAERRGRKLLMPFYGKDLAPAWRDFKAEVFGLESGDAPIYPHDGERRAVDMPQAPFLFAGTDDAVGGFLQFFAVRLTHKRSPLALVAHWWPTHGRLVELRGPLSEDDPNADVELARKLFSFFRREARGAEPKITQDRLVKVLAKLGPKATQTGAAKTLCVSDTALEKWRRKQGINTWREVVERYAPSPT